ncbi:pilus assembly protein N-terminal domain-containing protein, partial [Phascolarctobacterium succinatutens]|uniref:pilus assembly protein N-terminal domain-containing protein n=1 Tax=Phascolarctobacterium succinatutens TaxID=626940 RepID=UPI0026EDBD7C
MKIKSKIAGVLLSCMLVAVPVLASNMTVGVNQSHMIDAAGVNQVAIANPEIADVLVVAPGEVMLIGKKPGTTSLSLWRYGNRIDYTVVVDGSDDGTAGIVQSVLKYPDVHVSMAGGKIILEGMVENQYERTRAELIASSYGTVTNLLQMRHPKQVRIESRVIEISTDKVKNLGIAFGNAAGNDSGSSGGNSSVSLGTEGAFGAGQSHTDRRQPHPQYPA